MDYEDLENRISNLEEEIKNKLTWLDLMYYLFGGIIFYKIFEYFF